MRRRGWFFGLNFPDMGHCRAPARAPAVVLGDKYNAVLAPRHSGHLVSLSLHGTPYAIWPGFRSRRRNACVGRYPTYSLIDRKNPRLRRFREPEAGTAARSACGPTTTRRKGIAPRTIATAPNLWRIQTARRVAFGRKFTVKPLFNGPGEAPAYQDL